MCRMIVTWDNLPNGATRGDIVSCLPDGARAGRRISLAEWVESGEDPAAFPPTWARVIDVPGMACDLNLADPLTGPMVDGDGNPMTRPDGEPIMETHAFRAWQLDLDAMTASQRSALATPGVPLTIAEADAPALIRFRATGDTYDPPRGRDAQGDQVRHAPITEADMAERNTGRGGGRGGGRGSR